MEQFDMFLTSGIFIMVIYFVVFIFNILIWIFIIGTIIRIIKSTVNHNYFKKSVIVNKELSGEEKYIRNYNDVSKKQLEKFNVDNINILKDYFYEIFNDFENAYNNLDYNTMKLLSTKQLYQKYHTGIELDLKVGKKRVITGIERKKVIIFELDSTIAKQIATAMIEISYINYKLDKNGNVISGDKNNKITEKFEVLFRKDFESNEATECRNCGAEIIGKKCEYCGTSIKDTKFKISSIRKIIDK